ncbi:hypothetical protein EBZ80_16530 [bacterium]|nr:hypothetical protein [bacterium]
MRTMNTRIARLVLTASIITSTPAVATATVQQGNATFSTSPHQDNVSCQLPRAFPGIDITCAMSPQHFSDGDTCGRCVRIQSGYRIDDLSVLAEVTATTNLSPFVVLVNRVCPSCQPGDLVLAMEGDGQWRVQWAFVSCREARQNLSSSNFATREEHTPALRGGDRR